MNLKLQVLAATTTLQGFYSDAKIVETSLQKNCSNNYDCQLQEICLQGCCVAEDEDQNLTVPLIICSVAVFLIIVISARMCKLMFCHGERNGFVEGMDGNPNGKPPKAGSFPQQTKVKFTRSTGAWTKPWGRDAFESKQRSRCRSLPTFVWFYPRKSHGASIAGGILT